MKLQNLWDNILCENSTPISFNKCKNKLFIFFSSLDEQLSIQTVNLNEGNVMNMLKALKKSYCEDISHEVCVIQKKAQNEKTSDYFLCSKSRKTLTKIYFCPNNYQNFTRVLI